MERLGFGGSPASERNPPKHGNLLQKGAVPEHRSACFRQNGSTKKALGHAGLVSCVGGWIVHCFWTFEKILSYLDLSEGIVFVKKLNKII